MSLVCHKCGCSFGSLRWCHCATCHETFGGETAFDSHRVAGECQPPGESGLTVSEVKATDSGKPVWVRGYGKNSQKVSDRRSSDWEAKRRK